LAEGLRRAAAVNWNSARIRDHAVRFSRDRFVQEIEDMIRDTMSAPPAHQW
jgi:hypothetical protein